MKVTVEESAKKICPFRHSGGALLFNADSNCLGKKCMMFKCIGHGVSDSYVFDPNKVGSEKDYVDVYVCGLAHK